VGKAIAESILSVLFTEVALPPDAGADPNPHDSDDHDDEEDDPLVMVIKPDVY
jgi:hypothetical protein